MQRSFGFKRKRVYIPSSHAAKRVYTRRRVVRPRYRRPYSTIRGRGAYYVSGGGYVQGELGPFKGGAIVNAGYGKGEHTTSYIAPKITGLGAYNVSNIKKNTLIKPAIPQFLNATYAEGGTIVRHREYLGPIISSATALGFKSTEYPLNPGQPLTFPWLSSIAGNYEEYKPNGILFEFRSTCSDAIASSTNLALGQVMMATQYDPTDPGFASDVELLNYTWAQSGKISDNVQHFIECDPKQSPLAHLYTRSSSNATASDLRFSDFGRFTVATSGLQGTSVQVGQLWVTYEFILYKPKLGSLSSEAGGWFHYSCNNLVSITDPAGTISAGVYDAENNLSVTLLKVVDSCQIWFPIQFRPASFMVTVSYIGDVTGNVVAPVLLNIDGGVDMINHAGGNAIDFLDYPDGPFNTGNSGSSVWISIVADGAPHYLDLSYTGDMPANSFVDIYISQIPWLDAAIYG